MMIDNKSMQDLYDMISKLQEELQAVKKELTDRVDKAEHRMSKKLRLTELRFEFHLVEHCNLNCKGCNHFSPLAEEGYLSLEELDREMKQLSGIFHHKAGDIRMLGGEPLLHPEIDECFRIVRSYWSDSQVRLLTNGTLLDRQKESFWDSCRENDIIITPTKYPVGIDYDALEELAKSKGVKYDYFNDTGVVKTLYKLPVTLEPVNDARTSFFKCGMANYSVFLRDGRLYPCCVIPNVCHFNKYFDKNLKITDKDSIDIFSGVTEDDIYDFLQNPVPFCAYCDSERKVFGIDWCASERKIDEWIV